MRCTRRLPRSVLRRADAWTLVESMDAATADAKAAIPIKDAYRAAN